MGFFRKQFDKLVLSDHEWKKKYCPTLFHYLFCTNEERHEMYLKMCRPDPVVEKYKRENSVSERGCNNGSK